MASSRKAAGNNAQSGQRIIKVAPVTRAVRVAMATSATVLLLTAAGVSYAGNCATAGPSTQCVEVAAASQPVDDLTLITDAAPPSSVALQASSPGAASQLAPGVTITNSADITVVRPDDAFGLKFTSDGPVTLRNSGTLDVTSTGALADGIFVSGSDVLVRNSGGIDASGLYWAAGIEAQGSARARVFNSGAITATAAAGEPVFDPYGYGYVVGFTNGGAAYGVYATGGPDGTRVTNTADGSISASGALAQGIHAYNYDGTSVRVGNAGHIDATGYYASGIVAADPVDDSLVRVSNSGDIDVDGQFSARGIDALATGVGSSVLVTNSGTIDAYAANNYLGSGAGILAAADGDATVRNAGDITAGAYFGTSYGVFASSLAGTARVTNSGGITIVGGYGVLASSTYGQAQITNAGEVTVTDGNFGLNADGGDGASVRNSGTVSISDGKYNFALQATSSFGDVSARNSGTLVAGLADGSDKYAFGMLARARQGDTLATNSGAIAATGKYSYGLEAVADLGDVAVRNTGGIDATGGTVAMGVFGVALGEGGTTAITNTGHIAAQGIDYAAASYGVLGRADGGDVSIRNRGDVTATNVYGSAQGVAAQGTGDLTVSNLTGGSIVATATGLGNAGYSIYGDATGISAISTGGDVRVNNTGDIDASSAYGAAAGIVAAGYDVDVDNSGDIDAATLGTADIPAAAIGMYVHAYGTARASNKHDITVTSATGLADGIFATGNDVVVTNCNCGSIEATGFDWAAGIEAQGYNSADVLNKGSIAATATANEQGGPYGHAYGIYATGGDGGVSVTNAGSGSIAAIGAYATGIRGYDGTGGTIAVDNAGSIIATDIGPGGSYYGFATGIDATANAEGGNATVTSSGDISATGYFAGTGIRVTAAGAGDSANVDNSGTIYAASAPGGKYTSAGIDIAADGDITATNSGSITAYSGGFGYGISALSSGGDVVVTNSGDVTATAAALPGYGGAYAILSASQNGTAHADNSGAIAAVNALGIAFGINTDGGAYSYASNSGDITTDGKYSRAIFATSSLGDVVVQNSGSLHSTGKYAYGAGAVATSGDVHIVNAPGGDAYAGSQGGEFHYLGLSIGLFGRALQGDTTINNYGAASAGGDVGLAIGTYAGADFGSALVANGGTIDASNGYGSAEGVRIEAGTAAFLVNAGSITATANGDGYATSDAIGAAVDAPYGTAIAINVGDVSATAAAGMADGIFANGADAYVANAGSISASGLYWAAGIEAQGSNSAGVANAGTITATAATGDPVFDPYGYGYVIGFTNGGQAYGVYATGGADGVLVYNATSGSISASAALATGIRAYNGEVGATVVYNAGDVAVAGYYATGIGALTNVEGNLVTVINAGDIGADGQFAATGIDALAAGAGASAHVTNSGTIDAYAANNYLGAGIGIRANADGDATIDNTGTITAAAYFGTSYGALAASLAGAAQVNNGGDITVVGGYGAAAFSQYGTAQVDNTGLVTVTNGNFGVIADGGYATEVINSGVVDITGGKYNFAVQATSNFGDVDARNSGAIVAGLADGSDKYAFGILARARQGDVFASNSGAISATGKYSYGIEGVADLGDVSIANGASGTVTAYGTGGYGGAAFGIFGVSLGAGGDVGIDNDGNVTAAGTGYAAAAIGAFGRSDGGDVAITNAGDIEASNAYAYATALKAAAAVGGITIDNSGQLSATATGTGSYEYDVAADAIGIDAASPFGSSRVTNSGAIAAGSAYGLADGIFVSGSDVLVRNSGGIDASGLYWAAGIEAQGSARARVFNSGAITATAAAGEPVFDPYGYGYVVGFTNGGAAYGVYATGGPDGTRVTNTADGSISASGALAQGIHAYNYDGTSVRVGNAGHIDATGYYASGIVAADPVDDSLVRVSNSGDIDVDGQFSARGIDALATGVGSSVLVTNSGTIDAYAANNYLGSGAGILAAADGDATVRNAGDITAGAYFGTSYGVFASSLAGTARVTNSGGITIVGGYGVLASSTYGQAQITNAGEVTVTDGNFGLNADGGDGASVRNSGTVSISDGKYNFALQATSSFGDVSARNSGTLVAGLADGSDKYAFGMLARARQGDTLATNSGAIAATGKYSYGLEAVADLGDVAVRNTGGIDATGGTVAMGVFGVALGEGGTTAITNTGHIAAQGIDYAAASYGVLGRADGGDVSIRNRGDVTATNVYGSAQGVAAQGTGDLTVSNLTGGSIVATATGLGNAGYSIYGDATGISAISTGGDVRVNNTGSITATSQYGIAKGIYATGDNVTVTNSGDITATTGTSDAYNAIGVQIGAETSASFTNTGEIHTSTSTGTGIAVLIESNGSLNFTNSGVLEGAIITHAGDDAFTSTAGSTWNLVNQSTDLGAGSDRVTNVAGAAIRLFNGLIDLGEGDNSFRNNGLITVHGDSVIDMGGIRGAHGRSGTGGGWTASPRDPKPLPLFNNGTIDLVNGAGNDRLTVAGDLAGRGWIDVDMVGTGVADFLDITGSMRPNAMQTVNVSFHGLPGVGGDTMTFARVGGDSSADSFVAGQVLGADPRNFMNLGVDILSRIDATNVDADTFDASVQATGLNDTGSLAASLGANVQGLMTSQIGTWRQRTGVVPDATLDHRLSAYVRSFNDQGSVNASNKARNFGQDGNFAFGQANSGTQVGVGFAPGNGFNVGILMGKSSGQQNLTGAGFGRDAVLADSVGVSGTWMSPKGFYVDASYWSMDFSARMDSEAGRQALRGTANALNLESGYTYRMASGVSLEPQFQYTWTQVDQLLLQGPDADFRSNEDAWRRTRVGLMAWKAIPGASGRSWMPYGSVSAVRLDGGDAGYAINDAFLGNLDVRGNSALVEAGLGMQKGGFSANAALNWTDGDTVDSFLGGQLVLRYSW